MILINGEGVLCEAVEDLGREHLVPHQALNEYWPWARMRAEQEERRLFEEIRRLPASDYERVRILLAEHPTSEQGALWELWGDLWGKFGLFEPVSAWPWCNVAGWCFPCPACKWPMRAQPTAGGLIEVSCDAHGTEGVRYTCRARRHDSRPDLEGVGWASEPVTGFPAAGDSLAVTRTVWRYLSLPGQMEVTLRNALKGISGLDVRMYPDRDSYDLHITAGRPLVDKEWKVDAKAWRSADALADALLAKPVLPGPEPLIIVVPRRQRCDLSVLRERLRGRLDLRVEVDVELLSEIRRWCGLVR
ncbi:hypothetical protein ACFWAP_08655 [Streptomyces goshikiensis]|uniref:restriction endonuclease-related protein n=1 Tax=Streptomyces goshikiensis TaxID=1942 RepID=UPI00364FDDD0